MVERLSGSGPVVSDTSPLISLAAVGLLDLIERLYARLLIPTAVRDEYEAGRRSSEPRLSDLEWVQVVAVAPNPSVSSALDPGESAAVALALQLSASAILRDERLGRREAARLGLPIVGTLGVVLRAKQAGLLPSVLPTIDQMIANGVRIGPALRASALRQAGEAA